MKFRGLLPYMSLFGSRQSTFDADFMKFANRVYKFKKYGHHAETLERVVMQFARERKADMVLAVPSSKVEKQSQLQKIFGEGIRRTEDVPQRKYSHNKPVDYSGTVELTVNVTGKRILLVDDIITSGYSMLWFVQWLRTNGAAEVVPVGFGLTVSHAEECEEAEIFEKFWTDAEAGREFTIPELSLTLDESATVDVIDVKKSGYEKKREDMAKRSAEQSRAAREIGIPDEDSEGNVIAGRFHIPAVVDQERRESCRADFLRFCVTYHPNIFTKPVSKNHPKICKIIQEAVLHGGSYAWCDHRGGGKSTFSECLVEWALLYGHSRFVLFCGASSEAAQDSFESVKTELESNDLLLEDFPEVCYPVRKLEGKPQKAGGMLFNGEPVGLEWKKNKIVLPCLPGAVSAGSVFKAIGFSGRLRGQKHKNREGRQFRPDCVIVDDIQKDLTARNPENVVHQLDTLAKSINGLREKGHKFTLLIPGTRINPVCFMSQVTDRKKYPQYQGRVFRAMETLPENLDLWREYWKIWLETACELQEANIDDEQAWGKGKATATAFYREHRAEMDAGAEVAWADMYEEDEISGIQNIMNVFLQSEDVFWTEYQNQPRTSGVGASELTEIGILSKITPDIPQGIVPAGTTRLTLGCDVQKEMLFWLVTAWGKGYNGHIVDYGTIPEQPHRDFNAERPPVGLSKMFPDSNLEGRLYSAVSALVDGVLLREWTTETGEVMRIDRGLIDVNWSDSADTIMTIINRRFRSFQKNGRFIEYPLLPARGRKTSAGGKFYQQKKNMEGSWQFAYLQYPDREKKELVGTVWVNTNRAKTHAAQRLIAPMGAPDTVTLYAAPTGWHSLLVSHFTAEYAQPASIGELKYEKWTMKPSRTENHWWDCFVHCVVCNCMEGRQLEVNDAPERPTARVWNTTRKIR